MADVKSLLVVGGSGFIGRHLVRAAQSAGYRVTVLSLQKVAELERLACADYLEADISNLQQLNEVISERVFTNVVNLGGYVNHARYREGGREVIDTHFVGLENIIQCLSWELLESFVQIGSSDEYGDADSPQHEAMREAPISPYSLGKAGASQLLQMLHRTEGFPAIVLRLFLVYGPEQNNQRFLPQIISGTLKDESFATSLGEQIRDFCYIDDVVNGILLALSTTKAQGEIINIASGRPVAIRAVIEKVTNIVGSGSPRYGEVPYRKGENMSLYADISKAKKMLGWAPGVGLNEGLERTIVHYKTEFS